MDGWTILAWGAACITGVVLFLATVADEIMRIQQYVRRRHEASHAESAGGIETGASATGARPTHASS